MIALKRKFRIGAILSVVVIVLSLILAGAVFAGESDNGACNGQSSNGLGPGLQNCWGNNGEAGSGTCLGNGYGECSEGAGPGLENCWGKNAH